MKTFVMLLLTLSIATQGFAANQKREPSSYKLESGSLSSLVLSESEMRSLTPEDRTTYLIGLMAMAQVLEISQSDVLPKKNVLSIPEQKQKANPTSRLELWLKTFEPQANAWGVLVGWAIAGGSRLVAPAAHLYKSTRTYLAARSAIAAGAKAEAGTQAAIKAAQALAQKATAEAEKVLVKALREQKAAQMAYGEAIKTGKGLPQALEKAKESMSNLSSATAKFKSLGGSDAQKAALKKTFEKEGVTSLLSWNTLKKTAGAAGWASTGYTASEMLSEKVRITPDEFIAKAGETGLGKATVTTLSATKSAKIVTPTAAAGALTAEQTAEGAAVVSSGEAQSDKSVSTATASVSPVTLSYKGRSCLFGGHPSVWKDFGDRVFCTRPAASKSENCQEEKFFCQSYGLAMNEIDMKIELCIDTEPLTDLTIRCSEKLTELLSAKKATMDPKAYGQFADKLKENLKNLEASSELKDESGEKISIEAYCSSKDLVQASECKSIMNVVETFKKMPEVVATIASRAPATEPTPAEAKDVKVQK